MRTKPSQPKQNRWYAWIDQSGNRRAKQLKGRDRPHKEEPLPVAWGYFPTEFTARCSRLSDVNDGLWEQLATKLSDKDSQLVQQQFLSNLAKSA